MKATPTQGRRLIALLKRRPMTTMQMLQTGISVCPWKRIAEQLAEDEQLVKFGNWKHDGDVTWRVPTRYGVIKATKWTL